MKTGLVIVSILVGMVIGSATVKKEYNTICMYGTASEGCAMEGSAYDPDKFFQDRVKQGLFGGFLGLLGGSVVASNMSKTKQAKD
ncbi:MAG: hypothetical protein HY785_29400 [Oscillatoriophycideae cyanobacterium NC_groundwater_1537_Pr4_S-0.65um_50_18]|nr:hypothetical protein [Oscillatoriophycideae cyanobacterium NC_groundwater_1537_Pr4_S-0.65um_50_18]